jgi:hypothetical protein
VGRSWLYRALGGIGLLSAFPATGLEWSGFAAFDSRVFPYSPAFSGQRSDNYYASLMLQPELEHEWNGEQDRVTLVPFFRLEPQDNQRQHWDLREFNWQHRAGDWDVKAGVGKVFWGVTESRHLVDIINQADYVEDIDLEDKLGQPMVNFNYSGKFGTFSVFALPYFRTRNFEDRRGRFRPVIPIDVQHEHFQSSLKEWHPDFALRWSHTLGEWDIGMAQFWGTSREPSFDLAFKGANNPVLVPRYDIISQTSMDVQYTHEAWLWKLEAITRGGQSKRFESVVAGFEYTFFDLGHSGVDLGLLAEYQYDGRNRDIRKAPPVAFYNGVFWGMRLGVNDVQNTELLAGMTQDLDSGAQMINIEASRRVGDSWKVEMEARFFMNAPFRDFVLYSFHRDDYIQLRIGRYF